MTQRAFPVLVSATSQPQGYCVVCHFWVWCAGCVLFFEEDDVTVKVISDRCCAMLENFLRPKLDELFDEHGAENVWLQQDGVTAHASRPSLGILREMFPGHVV
jgi:hypothetical protein